MARFYVNLGNHFAVCLGSFFILLLLSYYFITFYPQDPRLREDDIPFIICVD